MVPTFDLYIQPFLDCLKGGGEKNLKTLSEELASFFKLTEEDLAETIAKGTQGRHYNRVSWAGTYTLKAGLTKRGDLGYTIIHYVVIIGGVVSGLFLGFLLFFA